MSSPGRMLSRALRTFAFLIVLAVATALLPVAAHAQLSGPAQRGGAGGHNPGGNNGTVKVEHVDIDDPPENNPHVGCTFLLEWYGFDKGNDIISKVTFAMHAPTDDVVLTVADGDSEVFVGEDDASGAGTASGLDATEQYTLGFDGDPHPVQGFHVKLTIHTPGSRGADVKHKVFWVEGCDDEPPAGPGISLVKDVVDGPDADHDASLGEELTYTFTVYNIGDVDLVDVTVDDDMLGLVDAPCVASLPVGGSATCAFSPMSHTVTEDDVTQDETGDFWIRNLATVTGHPHEGDPVTDDDPADIEVADVDPDDVDLVVTKTADPPVAQPGDEVTYTINVHNFGPGDADDVVVTDVLPAGTQFVDASDECTELSGTVTCALGSIEAGSDAEVWITVTVTATIPDGGTTSHQHQLDYTKVESHVAAFEGETSSTTECPTGYVATDGSVRLDHVDQGAGTFEDVDVVRSAVTADGRGWAGTVRNNTTGQVQAKVEVVCASERTVSGEDHSHPLVITGPATATQAFGPGRHTVDLSCAAGSYPIRPSQVITAGTAVVGTHRTVGGMRFIVDVDTSASGTFGTHCLSETLGTVDGHAHTLVFKELSDTVTVPAGGTVERKLTCPDGYKGIVAWADIDPGLVSLGNDPQPIIRVFKFYNPTDGPLDADFGLLCVAIRTRGADDDPGDVLIVNTASATTSSHETSPGDNSDSATLAVTETGVTAAPRAVVVSRAGKTAVQVAMASSGHRSVTLKLLAVGRVGGTGLRAGSVLAQARATLWVRTGTVRLVAKGTAGQALRSGKVGKAKLVILSRGHKDVRVVTLRR